MRPQRLAIEVQEVAFETWLLAALRMHNAPRRTTAAATGPVSRPAIRRVAGARALYWWWLAGVLLALALS